MKPCIGKSLTAFLSRPGHARGGALAGLIVSLLAIPIMRYLARRKIALAERLGSRALRADAMESITCWWLSFVVVVSLLAQAAVGAWWVAAGQGGREAWAGEECGCS